MREKLQEALLAAKGGEEEKARLLLAQYLREEPDYVPGWVLLSKLATSDVQKVAFLRKVLSLDPDHKYALEEMGRLTGATPPEISQQMAVEAGQVEPEEQAAAQMEMDVVEESVTPYAEAVAMADTPDAGAGQDVVEMEGAEVEEALPWEEAPLPWEEELQEATGEEEAFVETESAEEDLDWFLPELDDEVLATIEEVPTPAPEEEEEFDFSIFDIDEGAGELAAQESLDEDLFDYEGESFEAQASGDTMPAWMTEGVVEEGEAPAVREVDAEESNLLDEDNLPDWLQEEEPDAEWLGEAEVLEESTAEKEARLRAAMAEGQKRRLEEAVEPAGTSRWVITALVVLALIVFLAAVYFAAVYLI